MKVEKNARVAFQGERGAFSEEAAVKLLGEDIVLVPRRTFEAAFSAIDDTAADYILAPIENSLAGSVHRSFDLLVDSRLNILAEVIIPIVHNLIGAPGGRFEDLAVVESHPVALAQCEQFFSAHPQLKRIATEDTAGSVREVVRAGDRTRAAIAGRRAAQIYGGVILQEHLEDNRENYTRFLLLSPSSTEPENSDKLSLVFQLDHRPRALYYALEPFARRNVNLMKIESRPVHGKPVAIPLLFGPASVEARSGSSRGAARTGKAGRRVADSRVVRIRAAIGKRQISAICEDLKNDFQHVGRRN